MTDLSIIIVNYNVKEFLQNLLISLSKSLGKISSEIIVVDNASDDGSVEIVKEKFPQVKLIINEVNVGFGRANNQALEIAEGKYLVLINPDTIVTEDTFEKLIDFFERTPDAGMAGPKVLNPDGSLQLPCRRSFPGPWTSFTKVTGLSKLFPNSKIFAKYNLTYLDENETYEVDAISGAFMMMRKDVYKKVGGFDPQFFMYGEDLDLCYRIQKASYKVYYFHKSQIIHYKGESTKRSRLDETTVFYDAMHLFVKKHFSSSFLVEAILQAAIWIRKIFAFVNVYRLIILSLVLDLIFFAASMKAAEYIYSYEGFRGFPPRVIPWIYFVPAAAQIIISAFTGVYKKNSISVLRSAVSLIIGFIILSSITFFLKQFAFSRAVLILTYSILIFAFSFWRIFVKIFFKIGLSGESKKNRTLIVGSSSSAVQLIKKLKSNISSIYNIVGLIGLTRKEIGERKENYLVIGSVENIKKIIQTKKIDQVIFSSPEITFNQMFAIVSECQGEGVDFKVTGNELDFMVGKSAITMLDNIPLLNIQYNISSPVNKFLKTGFDLLFSILLIIFVYPFIFLFSLLKWSQGDFINFILQIPKVLIRKKSFVGPRNKSYLENLYLGKIGITGLWFTENVSSKDEEELTKLDIFYAKNQNIWLDLEIIGKTFSKIFFRTEKG